MWYDVEFVRNALDHHSIIKFSPAEIKFAVIMRNHQMEIKVAVLGNVTAGKTTVLNALLQNKYGEVAKKRTTAGAHYFYINVAKDVIGTIEHCVVAESIHEEITKDNQNKVRDGYDILKKEFEIEIPNSIVRCHKDTV